MPFYQSTPKLLQKLFSKLFWYGNPNENNVYLTFDDGPHPSITPWVMAQLDKFNFKATFFCVGQNAAKHPKIISELTAKGHRIGNHTMHHTKGWNTSLEDYIQDVEACRQIIDTNLFRPPYGRITPQQINVLKKNYKIIMWSLLSCDYLKDLNNIESLKILMKKTKGGSVVVFHDSEKAEKNLKILLPLYLQFLNDKGFNCIVL
jgi:peptidoglycan/xylan/chitin deacetylase (PgdA/CDA1 family)